jgi:hypothetical protein
VTSSAVVQFPGTSTPAADASAVGGWLGLTPATIEVDWDAVSKHGPCVMVAPRSPAWRSGLRSGDFVESINDMDFVDFHAALPPTGSQFQIVFFRKRLGQCRVIGKLGVLPKAAKVPIWRRQAAVLPGREVEKHERPEYLQSFVAKHPQLKGNDVRLMTLLIEHHWHRGSIPKHSTLAREMGCSTPTVKRSADRCRHFGILDWVSGRARRTSNSYTPCWPAGHSSPRTRKR